MDVRKPMTREDQRKFTRRRIIDAARACFYECGAGEVSMEHIARAAHVGRATLYLHFPNKDAILLDLLSQNLAGVKQIFADLCARERIELAAVQNWLRGYVDTLRSHREAARLMHVGMATTDDARGLIHAHHVEIARMLAARFPRISDGTVPAQTRLMLMIGRIDEFASAAAATPPRLDPEAGLDFVSRELMALIDGERV
jgi:AcrR family transcriptional regulator